jgi:hypothetical protein
LIPGMAEKRLMKSTTISTVLTPTGN